MILEIAIRFGIWFWIAVFFLVTVQIARTVLRGLRAGRRDYRQRRFGLKASRSHVLTISAK
jgi:hypothetical protein